MIMMVIMVIMVIMVFMEPQNRGDARSNQGASQLLHVRQIEIPSCAPQQRIRRQPKVDPPGNAPDLVHRRVPPKLLLQRPQFGKLQPLRPPHHVRRGGQEVALGVIARLVGDDQVREPVFRVAGPRDEVVDVRLPGDPAAAVGSMCPGAMGKASSKAAASWLPTGGGCPPATQWHNGQAEVFIASWSSSGGMAVGDVGSADRRLYAGSMALRASALIGEAGMIPVQHAAGA